MAVHRAGGTGLPGQPQQCSAHAHCVPLPVEHTGGSDSHVGNMAADGRAYCGSRDHLLAHSRRLNLEGVAVEVASSVYADHKQSFVGGLCWLDASPRPSSEGGQSGVGIR